MQIFSDSVSPTYNDQSVMQLWDCLGNPYAQALKSYHENMALSCGNALRYRPEISLFAAVPENPTEQDWKDLAHLMQSGDTVLVTFDTAQTIPPWFEVINFTLCYRLLGDTVTGEYTNAHVRTLTVDDNEQIMKLFTVSSPGTFAPRTVTMGNFFGYFPDDTLVAIAGERAHTQEFIEISGVSTHPDYHGKGLAQMMIRHTIADIKDKKKIPFLHCAANNHRAWKLYEKMGFYAPRASYMYAIKFLGHSH